MLAKDIANHLEYLGYGNTAQDIFIGDISDLPDNQIVVYHVDAIPAKGRGLNSALFSIKIRVRNVSYEEAYKQAWDIYSKFYYGTQKGITLSNGRQVVVNSSIAPKFFNYDGKERASFMISLFIVSSLENEGSV